MQRARLLFAQYLMFSVASLTGLVIGADQGGLRAATWGLTAGSAVGLLIMIIMYGVAVRQLAAPASTPPDATTPQPAPEPPAVASA